MKACLFSYMRHILGCLYDHIHIFYITLYAFVCVFVSVARSGNFAPSGMECDGVMDLPL